MADTPTTDALPSRLMSLPAELRDRIWVTVFAGWTQRIGFSYDTRMRAAPLTVDTTAYRRQPPLLVACKQIYAEAIGMYYSTAIFFVDRHEESMCHVILGNWLRSIGPERAKLVRNVRFHMCPDYYGVAHLDFGSMRDPHFDMEEAEGIIKCRSTSGMVIKADLWYQTQWELILIWTPTPVSTDQEVRRVYEQKDEGFYNWLEAKGSDVKTWELRGISKDLLRRIDAHESYRDRIE